MDRVEQDESSNVDGSDVSVVEVDPYREKLNAFKDSVKAARMGYLMTHGPNGAILQLREIVDDRVSQRHVTAVRNPGERFAEKEVFSRLMDKATYDYVAVSKAEIEGKEEVDHTQVLKYVNYDPPSISGDEVNNFLRRIIATCADCVCIDIEGLPTNPSVIILSFYDDDDSDNERHRSAIITLHDLLYDERINWRDFLQIITSPMHTKKYVSSPDWGDLKRLQVIIGRLKEVKGRSADSYQNIEYPPSMATLESHNNMEDQISRILCPNTYGMTYMLGIAIPARRFKKLEVDYEVLNKGESLTMEELRQEDNGLLLMYCHADAVSTSVIQRKIDVVYGSMRGPIPLAPYSGRVAGANSTQGYLEKPWETMNYLQVSGMIKYIIDNRTAQTENGTEIRYYRVDANLKQADGTLGIPLNGNEVVARNNKEGKRAAKAAWVQQYYQEHFSFVTKFST